MELDELVCKLLMMMQVGTGGFGDEAKEEAKVAEEALETDDDSRTGSDDGMTKTEKQTTATKHATAERDPAVNKIF